MRPSLPLSVMAACFVAPLAWSQAAGPQPAVTKLTASQPSAGDPNASQHSASAATAAGKANVAAISRPPHARHAQSQSASAAAKAGAPAGKSAGVLALGATDITGNKELPKVMVIVPWKDSMGAGGVIKPTDSLMDEVLEPVDRGVFQRRIRYYGELNAAGQPPAGGKVAPVGDSK